jgi:threonine dehydratase
VAVTEQEIVAAVAFLFERMKLVVEPSGAVAFAALLAGKLEVQGRRVGVVLSGGNIGSDALSAMIEPNVGAPA